MPRYKVKGNIIIQADSIEEIKPVYLDGNFLRCPIYPEVYYMDDGKRRWVKTIEVWVKMETFANQYKVKFQKDTRN